MVSAEGIAHGVKKNSMRFAEGGGFMYTVEVTGRFESAHRLREYKGKCENLHGHNWKVQVLCSADVLDDIGIVIDFRILKEALKSITDEIDHTYLNENPFLKGCNPTSENVARLIFEAMKERLAAYPAVTVAEVAVWETDSSCARYRN